MFGLLHSLSFIFILAPASSSWHTILVWLVRLLTFSLLLRTYILPWVFARLSKHIRIRSVSLRSLRGLYIKRGATSWRVERIAYRWSYTEGLNRFAITVDGLKLEIGRSELSQVPRKRYRHRRRLTLADFGPSPMARRAWRFVSKAYTLLDPIVRPVVRALVASGLAHFIRWLPVITQRLTFDLNSAIVTFQDMPGTRIKADLVHFQVALGFSQLDNVADVPLQPPGQRKPGDMYTMSAWQGFLKDSLKRSWDRAWGRAEGLAILNLQITEVAGYTSPTSVNEDVRFFGLPGLVDLHGSLKFNPRSASIQKHSFITELKLGELYLALDACKQVIALFKRAFPKRQDIQEAGESDPLSPLSDSITTPPHSSTTSLFSPISPHSPFFDAISSVRVKRRLRHKPSKLSDPCRPAPLSILLDATLKITTVRIVAHPSTGFTPRTYETLFHDVSFSAEICDTTVQPFYSRWMGTCNPSDELQSDAYAFHAAARGITVDRYTDGSHLRLVNLSSIQFLSVISQWPLPLLQPSKFMIGDPNAAFLGVQLELGRLRFTERLEYVHEMMTSSPHPSVPQAPVTVSPVPHFDGLKRRVPRIVIDACTGPICGRIIAGLSRLNDVPRALELRTEGLKVSASSTYTPQRIGKLKAAGHAPAYCLPVHMDMHFSAMLSPALLRVRSSDKTGTSSNLDFSLSDPSFLDDPALLSLDAFEIVGDAKAKGDVNDDGDSVPAIEQDSVAVDAHAFSDTLAIELWHPAVITVLSQLMPPNHRKSPSTSIPSHTSPLDRLPIGLSVSMAIPRIVVYVTAPELNRRDGLDLSRGFALRTGLRLQYCFLDTHHAAYFEDVLQTTQTRHKLYLPETHHREAISSARAGQPTATSSALLNAALVGLSVRSAVSTPYASDEPLLTELDDPKLLVHEFLRIKHAFLTIKLAGRRQTTAPQAIPLVLPPVPATCEVSLRVPDTHVNFRMSHVYSVLLATRTIAALTGGTSRRPTLPGPIIPTAPPAHLSLLLHVNVQLNTLQILWKFHKQTALTRLDAFVVNYSTEDLLSAQLSRLRASTLLPTSQDRKSHWATFATLRNLSVSLPNIKASPPALALEGDSLHIHIAAGFVLSDLILDINVALKAARHLMQIIPSGRVIKMSAPDAEPAKSVPNVKLRLRCFCFDAADDAFESKLGVIQRAGLDAARFREERERAFMLKVSAIQQGIPPEPPSSSAEVANEYTFDSIHTVSVENARNRLHQVNALDWTFRHRTVKELRATAEEAYQRHIRGPPSYRERFPDPDLVQIDQISLDPPLFRILLNGLSFGLTPPSFPLGSLSDFLHENGSGVPKDTQYYLLVPLHLQLRSTALRVWLRDYPIPLVDISNHSDEADAALSFHSELVIAEETGTDASIEWLDCPVIESNQGIEGAAPLSISVPKTIMPVKTYANPDIHISTANPTTLSWGVSYGPTLQDLARIIDTLSSPPRDPSPALGFWDKLRLVFHWKIKTTFKGDVNLYLRGSRDPYELTGEGAGFVLSWKGHPKIFVGYPNTNSEVIQVISDSMIIAIPSQETLRSLAGLGPQLHPKAPDYHYQKICAKLASGVRFGLGCMLERACGSECLVCSGIPFERRCRFFDFHPHYTVKLRRKVGEPESKGPEDSYNGFRSDFIHFSISLTSSVRPLSHIGHPLHHAPDHLPSSLHLTPKAFAHFWSWLALFDSVLSLPIRQGNLYPRRHISPKFGRHLATLKYRISVARLFVLHSYVDESRETWEHGVTPFVGIKALIDDLQIDMHQRDQETIIQSNSPQPQTSHHKALYAAEVVLKGLDLRCLLATFSEPLKQSVPLTGPAQTSTYRDRQLPPVHLSSPWIDKDDFVEVDWTPAPHSDPVVHLLPVLACPRFSYYKRQPPPQANQVQRSKFGDEHSHTCMLGQEPSSSQIQLSLASARIAELKKRKCMHESTSPTPLVQRERVATQRMIKLLEDYVEHLQDPRSSSEDEAYLFPSDDATSEEWEKFDNVYQIHCPKIFLSSAIRDIMLQYYYCSRARRGYEYHLATRAVRYILDQAQATSAKQLDDLEKPKSPFQSGQAAANALRKILTGDTPKTSVEISDLPPADIVDPMHGWSDAVSLLKSHFFLLLKPQVVLRGERSSDSALILAAVQAKLQLFNIMDKSNVNDPVSGKVMSRSYGSLSGLQTFAPTSRMNSEDPCIPLEVLVDFRCESDEFDRLVPQTDATFHYDKFNRLRLRNNVTSIARTGREPTFGGEDHLRNQTDLIQFNVPRFTVTASEENFQTISDIITNVILFSDATQKTRLDKLETLLFTYDFTDLLSAAGVVSDVQSRLRNAAEVERLALAQTKPRDTGVELLKLKAHIYLLAEELTCLFDAIKMAQDRVDDLNDQKSALLLRASSNEISWRMLDENKGLLAKLALRHIKFKWLSRRDSSTVNSLDLADLQAFDGARNALWTEILCKYDEPANHPLLKKGLFLLAHWTVLAPVGGITIYEDFELTLHPIRLQIDASLGRRIMEYLWPARKDRRKDSTSSTTDDEGDLPRIVATRASLDSPRALQGFPSELTGPSLQPPQQQPLRRLGTSRSFTDLRLSIGNTPPPPAPSLSRTRSSDALKQAPRRKETARIMDAAEMKTRSSQKSFVLVKISSLHILLSIKKDDAFECRDARIRTRDLEYRNRTWSFEELVDQFIPSDMSWRGWVKMALHQPLVPVFPVARELISKTKWITASKSNHSSQSSSPSTSRPDSRNRKQSQSKRRSPSPHHRWKQIVRKRPDTPPGSFDITQHTAEPEDMEAPSAAAERMSRPESRPKVFNLFRKSSKPRKSTDGHGANNVHNFPFHGRPSSDLPNPTDNPPETV